MKTSASASWIIGSAHIHTAHEMREHGRFQCSIKTTVNLGVFQKIAIRDMLLKFVLGEKKIILTVNLSGPWCAGGAGDGINKILFVAE